MTGDQLRKLREANGLSKRQLGLALGFKFTSTNSAGRKVSALESKSFVPEPLVHRINKMLEDGRLVTT